MFLSKVLVIFELFKSYLKKYKFGNAVQDNLWESLHEVSFMIEIIFFKQKINLTNQKKEASNECKLKKLNLTDVMNTWTKQMGHPLVTIKTLNQIHLALSQTHFLFDSTTIPPGSTYKYSISLLLKSHINISVRLPDLGT